MQHLEEGTIHAWLDGALDQTEAARVSAHVASCSSCAAMAAEARGLIAGASRVVGSLDTVPGNVLPASSSSTKVAPPSLWGRLRLSPARAAIAATLLIGVASMFSVRRQGATDLQVPRPITAIQAPVAPTTQPAPAATTPPVATREAAKPVEPGLSRRELAAQDAAPQNRAVELAKPTEPTASVAVAPAAPVPAPSAAEKTAAQGLTAQRMTLPRQRALALNSVAADAAQPLCLTLEPAASDTGWPGLPGRFRLDRDSTGRAQVHMSNPAGTADGAGLAGTWRALTPSMTAMTLISPGRPELQLVFDNSATRAQARQGDRAGSVEVRRFNCPP